MTDQEALVEQVMAAVTTTTNTLQSQLATLRTEMADLRGRQKWHAGSDNGYTVFTRDKLIPDKRDS